MSDKLVICVDQIDVEVAIMQDGGDVLRRVGKACRTLAKSHSMNGCVSSRSHICACAGRGLTCGVSFFNRTNQWNCKRPLALFWNISRS